MTQESKVFQFEPDEIGLFFAAEQTCRDYQDFIKTAVLPQVSARFELRLRELLTLYCIGSAVSAISLSDVATIMRQDAATLTRSSIVLVGKKMVTTSKSFEDSRVKLLHLTDLGKEVLELFKDVLNKTLEHVNAEKGGASFGVEGRDMYAVPLKDVQRRAEMLAYEATIFNKRFNRS